MEKEGALATHGRTTILKTAEAQQQPHWLLVEGSGSSIAPADPPLAKSMLAPERPNGDRIACAVHSGAANTRYLYLT
jgi:hypothetical protein